MKQYLLTRFSEGLRKWISMLWIFYEHYNKVTKKKKELAVTEFDFKIIGYTFETKWIMWININGPQTCLARSVW